MKQPIHLSAHHMRDLEAHWKTNPGYHRMWQLHAEYALGRGGLVLEFWRRAYGPAFGEPVITPPTRIAQDLAAPMSEIQKIYEETRAWVQPRLERDPDYRRLKKSAPKPAPGADRSASDS